MEMEEEDNDRDEVDEQPSRAGRAHLPFIRAALGRTHKHLVYITLHYTIRNTILKYFNAVIEYFCVNGPCQANGN